MRVPIIISNMGGYGDRKWNYYKQYGRIWGQEMEIPFQVEGNTLKKQHAAVIISTD